MEYIGQICGQIWRVGAEFNMPTYLTDVLYTGCKQFPTKFFLYLAHLPFSEVPWYQWQKPSDWATIAYVNLSGLFNKLVQARVNCFGGSSNFCQLSFHVQEYPLFYVPFKIVSKISKSWNWSFQCVWIKSQLLASNLGLVFQKKETLTMPSFEPKSITAKLNGKKLLGWRTMWFIGIWNNQWSAFICIKGIITCGIDGVTDKYGFVNVGPQYTFGSGWTISHCVTKICIFFIHLMFYHLAPNEIRFMIHFSLSFPAELFLMWPKTFYITFVCWEMFFVSAILKTCWRHSSGTFSIFFCLNQQKCFWCWSKHSTLN